MEKKSHCPLCLHELTWTSTNPMYKEEGENTHIYVCPECPFIGFEYYSERNLKDLIKYLTPKV